MMFVIMQRIPVYFWFDLWFNSITKLFFNLLAATNMMELVFDEKQTFFFVLMDFWFNERLSVRQSDCGIS